MLRDFEEKAHEKKKKVKISRDFVKKFFAITIIVIILVINGFVSFMSFGGVDFSKLMHSAYWISYGLLSLSEIAVLLSFYIFRKIKNLKEQDIVDLSSEINDMRNKIYTLNMPKNCADWLRNYYNPREKLNLFEDKITSIQSNLKIDEPFEVEKEDKKLYRKYLRKKKEYDKNMETYNWCLGQLELVKKCRLKLEFSKQIVVEKAKLDKIDIEKIKDLENKIEEINQYLQENKFAIQKYKYKYENVYWDTLIANHYENAKTKKSSAYFHEKSILSKKLVFRLLVGLLISSVMTCMLPPLFNTLSWQTLLDELFKLVIFSWMAFSGIMLADSTIFFNYKQTLNCRKTIYNELNYDLGITNIEIEKKEK